MPVYFEKTSKPSLEEFNEWKSIGYLGDYDKYLEAKNNLSDSTFIFHGDLGEHCSDCAGFSEMKERLR